MSEAAEKAWEEWADERAAPNPNSIYVRHRDGTPFHAGWLAGFAAGGIHALEQAADDLQPKVASVKDVLKARLAPMRFAAIWDCAQWLRARAKQLREDSQ